MENLQNMFCLLARATWYPTRRSTAAVDLFCRGAAVNSALFDSGIAYHSVPRRKGLCLCWSYWLSGKYLMTTFTFYPDGPSISTLGCVCTKCSIHNHDVQCEKDVCKCEKYTPLLHSAWQNVSVPNSLASPPILKLNTQQNAALLFEKRRWWG
jgi:hypothetical protein